jgi:hypothetical protein
MQQNTLLALCSAYFSGKSFLGHLEESTASSVGKERKPGSIKRSHLFVSHTPQL